MTIECDQDVPAPSYDAEDNCSENLTDDISEAMIPGDCPNSYTIERTYSVSDECGNTSTAVQTITVQDTTAPEFGEFPADANVECGDDVPVTFPTASDNCDDDVEITYNDAISTGGGGDGDFNGCSADFRTELGFFSFGEPRVFEALGVTIGDGNELDLDDELQNPEGFVGAISVDH